jgi:hypothetical protein
MSPKAETRVRMAMIAVVAACVRELTFARAQVTADWAFSSATDNCPGLEQVFEAYYSYALSRTWRLSLDYQFINNLSRGV